MKVDKEKWEKGVLSDCITTVKVKEAVQKRDYRESGKYPIISQEKDFISGYCDSEENLNSIGEVVIFGDHTRVVKFVDFDFCVGADGVKVLRPNERISPKYLFYFLKWADIPNNGYSRHFKYLKELTISYPNLPLQHSIARELDSVQAMIDGYRQQIADLDTLAQSIFLDTFGDPVSNPKGWETNSFGNLFSLKSGDGLSAKNFEEGEYPVYGGNGITGYHSSFNKNGEFIIIGRVGAYCGNVRLVRGRFWLTDNAFELKQTNIKFESRFLTMLLDMLNLGNKAKAMAQPVISNVSLKHVSVILPPLPLQLHFSAQIESIEKQKEQLRRQQADAETLMAERMQYYFS